MANEHGSAHGHNQPQWDPCNKRRADAVGRFTSASTKRKTVDAPVANLVAQVRAAELEESLNGLVSFRTRWAQSPVIGNVTAWLRNAFLSRGYATHQVRFQDFEVPQLPPQRNVLCGAPSDHPGFTLVCAHYDSVSEMPATSAPGCDDNATGVAALLEAARVLQAVPLRRGVLFAAFGAEEQGLYGSQHCAEIAAVQGWKIDLVLNLDMVGYVDPARPRNIIIEFDQGNRDPGNDAAARAFGLQMAQHAADYTTMSVEHTDIWNSDYMPFEAKGYACVGVYDGAFDTRFYHRSSDTLANVDIERVTEVAKLVVATVASIAL